MLHPNTMEVMKKKLWSLLVIMMAAMVSFSLSSCGDDEADGNDFGNDTPVDNSAVVGNWYFTNTVNGTYGTFDNIMELQLRSDNTGKYTWAQYEYDENQLGYVERHEGKYTYDKAAATLTFEGHWMGAFTSVEVTENTLTCTIVNKSYTFKRGSYNWGPVSGGTILDEHGNVIQQGR